MPAAVADAQPEGADPVLAEHVSDPEREVKYAVERLTPNSRATTLAISSAVGNFD